MINETQIL